MAEELTFRDEAAALYDQAFATRLGHSLKIGYDVAKVYTPLYSPARLQAK